MRILLFTLSFLLFSSLSFAATITWNGSFGFWHQTNRWDTGQVPGPDDEVIIPSGFAIVASNTFARAEKITINPNARLGVDVNGTLRIADENNVVGITNRGFVFVLGTIELENLQASFNTVSPRGILNERFFKIFNGGSVVTNNIKNTTITNASNATFVNEGDISMSLQNSAWTTGINNIGRFDNNLTGIIHQKSGFYGVINTPDAIGFRNRGKIVIESTTGGGFINTGFAKNFNSGSISMYKTGLSNTNNPDALLRNEGSIFITKVTGFSAIYNHGVFENAGWLSIVNCDTGINNHSPNASYSPVFENTNYLSITDCPSEAITNEHDFINSTDGYVIVDSRISTYNNGLYTNSGIFKAQISNNYSPNFINNGILEDTHGKFITGLTNNKVVVRPISGPIFVGQSISPALDIASFSGMAFGQWQDDLGGDICGAFSLASNSLQPNLFAQNDNDPSLWVHLGIAGNTDWFEVRVLPNTPLQVAPNTSLNISSKAEKKSHQFDADITISTYPNPTRGTLNFSINSAFNHENITITVRNAAGQELTPPFRITPFDEQSFNLPNHLPNGIYFLEFSSTDRVLKVEQIVLSK